MWIEAHQALRHHPKTTRLAVALRIPRAQAIGHLLCLWWWCVDYAPGGNVSAFGDAEVAAAADWTRRPVSQFSEALIDAGWLDADGCIHDWADWGGKTVARREADVQRKREQRARTSGGSPADGARTEQTNKQDRTELLGADAPSENGDGGGHVRRDELFEAIVEACGYDLGHLTATDRGRVNRAAKELRDLYRTDPTMTAELPAYVRGFALQYPQHWPGADLTPQALTGNWAGFMANKLSEPARRPR